MQLCAFWAWARLPPAGSNVPVHKFVCRGTIEERIDALIESKQQLAKDVLGGGQEINLTEMNDRDLLALVKLDLDAAMREG